MVIAQFVLVAGGFVSARADEPVTEPPPAEETSTTTSTPSDAPADETSPPDQTADGTGDRGGRRRHHQPADETTDATDAPAPEELPALDAAVTTEPAPLAPAVKGAPLDPQRLQPAVEGDLDNDTIPDVTDNCDVTFNPLQGDADLDGLGNSCDPDFGEQDLVGGTIFQNRLCEAIVLVPNDDSSSPESQKVFFPTPLNFFGAEQRFAYVNNNGNITFVNPLPTFTPFEITATTPPIIAPYLADVDTRPGGGGRVSYGVALNSPTFGGRNVSCFTWEGVGYFANHVEKRNTFQLLIVERSDIAPGDFDIYFNYARVDWETGDASGGTNGLGGTSAGAGFSSGTGLESAFFSMPCSLINGACLDSNQNTGLRNTSTNTTIKGRHIFRVRSGGEQFNGEVKGVVKLVDPPLIEQNLVNALVELCEKLPDGKFANCRSTFTVANGSYDITNLPAGDYRLRVFPQRIGGRNQNPRTISDGFQPSGLGIDPLPIEVKVLSLGNPETRIVDLETSSGHPPPTGVTLGTFRNNGFFPHIVAGKATTFRVATPCGTDGTFEIFQNGQLVAGGVLHNIGFGVFQGSVTIPTPGLLDVHVNFPGCTQFNFDAYVDPSGLVVDQDGHPIAGAHVVLLRSDFAEGPFAPVESGSEIMSPANRTNPDVTDADGFFGWDVLSGFYKVTASSTGCTDGATAVLPVPPEQVDLRITLDCSAPTTTTEPEPEVTEPLARTGFDARSLVIESVLLMLAGALVLAASRRAQQHAR